MSSSEAHALASSEAPVLGSLVALVPSSSVAPVPSSSVAPALASSGAPVSAIPLLSPSGRDVFATVVPLRGLLLALRGRRLLGK